MKIMLECGQTQLLWSQLFLCAWLCCEARSVLSGMKGLKSKLRCVQYSLNIMGNIKIRDIDS